MDPNISFTMRFALLLLTLICYGVSTSAQSLYIKTFGKPGSTPLIFIHGGPAGSAVHFEATTAQKLADKGFYVIVYDRRGECRSVDANAALTYEEAFTDLNNIYRQYKLTKANLVGFSFGGLVTTLFAEKYPEKVQAIVLCSALFAQQATYDHILDTVTRIYRQQSDTAKLREVAQVKQLDKKSARYRGECFRLASENGFFRVAHPDPEAQEISRAYDSSALKQTDIRNKNAPERFYKNETRVNIDVQPVLAKLTGEKHIQVYGLYGKLDGIFSTGMLHHLEQLLGTKHFRYVDNSSHYLYADQQTVFLDNVTRWLK